MKLTNLAKFSLSVLVIGIAVFMASCSSGSTGTDNESFSISLIVTDIDGNPISGVEVGAMPALPEWANPFHPYVDFPDSRADNSSDRPAIVIRFDLTEASTIKFRFYDVAGDLVHEMDEMMFPGGQHELVWRWNMDSGASPGYFLVELSIESDSVDWEIVDTKGVLLLDPFPANYSLGSTNEQGTLRLTDPTIVPGLWPSSTIEVTTDSPESEGTYILTTETWFYCDDGMGRTGWGVLHAIEGPQDLMVTIQEDLRVVFPRSSDTPEICDWVEEQPDAILHPPYPNPFN